MTTLVLYHGTSLHNANNIMQSGFYPGRVYLTPRREIAAEYANQGIEDEQIAIVVVSVNTENLSIDNESYDGQNINEAIKTGQSVYANSKNVKIDRIIIL